MAIIESTAGNGQPVAWCTLYFHLSPFLWPVAFKWVASNLHKLGASSLGHKWPPKLTDKMAGLCFRRTTGFGRSLPFTKGGFGSFSARYCRGASWSNPMQMTGQVECKWVGKSVKLPTSGKKTQDRPPHQSPPRFMINPATVFISPTDFYPPAKHLTLALPK
jgi:hypothetical protein